MSNPPATSLNARGLLSLLVWELGPPAVVYYIARSLGYNSYVALLAGAVAAGLQTAYMFFKHRRFDGVSAFLAVMLLTGVGLAFLTGDRRFLLAKASMHVAFVGLIFVGTGLAGRPLTYYFARRAVATSKEAARAMDQKWNDSARFRRPFYIAALVWGFGLLSDAVVHIPVIFLLPLDTSVALSYLLHIAVLASLIVWTRRFRIRAQQKAAASELNP